MAPPSQGSEPPANPERFTILVSAGVGLLFAGLGLLGTWAVRCSISQCDFLFELTVAAGIVLPATGVVAAIEGLTDIAILEAIVACINGPVLAIISGAVAVIGASVIFCKTNAGDAPDSDTIGNG